MQDLHYKEVINEQNEHETSIRLDGNNLALFCRESSPIALKLQYGIRLIEKHRLYLDRVSVSTIPPSKE